MSSSFSPAMPAILDELTLMILCTEPFTLNSRKLMAISPTDVALICARSIFNSMLHVIFQLKNGLLLNEFEVGTGVFRNSVPLMSLISAQMKISCQFMFLKQDAKIFRNLDTIHNTKFPARFRKFK